MEITAYWEGGYRTRVPIRRFDVRIDEPPEYGGDDTGPMPTEILLASLASCFARAVAHVARKRGQELPDLTVTVRGEYEGLRFKRITLEALSSHPREQLEGLVERAIGYCYVTNTLLKTPEIEFRAGDGRVTHAPPPRRD